MDLSYTTDLWDNGALHDGGAAVDGDDLAVHVAAVVAEQAHDRVAELGGLTDAAHRNALRVLGGVLLVGPCRAHAFTGGRARTDTVDAHTPLAVLERSQTREGDHATLARGVTRSEPVTAQTRG